MFEKALYISVLNTGITNNLTSCHDWYLKAYDAAIQTMDFEDYRRHLESFWEEIHCTLEWK